MERDTREKLLENLRDAESVLERLAASAEAAGLSEQLCSLQARVAINRGRVLAGESDVPLAEDLEAFTEVCSAEMPTGRRDI